MFTLFQFEIIWSFFQFEVGRLQSEIDWPKSENGENKANAAKHTHLIDARYIAVKKIMATAKVVAKESNKTTREIYSDSLAGVPAEVVSRMPNLHFPSKFEASGNSTTQRRQQVSSD